MWSWTFFLPQFSIHSMVVIICFLVSPKTVSSGKLPVPVFCKVIGTVGLRWELSSVNVQSLTQDTKIKVFCYLTEVGRWCPLCYWRKNKGLAQWHSVPGWHSSWVTVSSCDMLKSSRNIGFNRKAVELLTHSSLYSKPQQSGENFFINLNGHWRKTYLKPRGKSNKEKLHCLAPKKKFRHSVCSVLPSSF